MQNDLLWQQYQSKLKGLLYSKLNQPEDVEDLLQEILLKTHQQLPQLHESEKLNAWLWRLANNTLTDFYRQRARQNQALEQVDWQQAAPQLSIEQLANCLEPMLQALPRESAELLRQIDLEGQSQRQLAEQLGISYSGLKSRVQRARSALRQVVESCCTLEANDRGELLDFTPQQNCCHSAD